MNNTRLIHSRSAFTPFRDGEDRWIVKTFVKSDLWHRPGTGKSGVTQYPRLVG